MCLWIVFESEILSPEGSSSRFVTVSVAKKSRRCLTSESDFAIALLWPGSGQELSDEETNRNCLSPGAEVPQQWSGNSDGIGYRSVLPISSDPGLGKVKK